MTGLGEAGLVFLAALLVRLATLGTQPPHADDFYHYYAARSFLADGTYAIFSGIYERSGDFTWLVAMSMRLFGESIAAARLPSLVPGALLAAAAYAWMRQEAGRGPAVMAAVLIVMLRPLTDLSGLIRFYSLQTLLVWLGCVLLYRVVVAGRLNLATLLTCLAAALALGEATRLQVVSVIGLAGVAAWAAAYWTWRARERVSGRRIALAWLVLLALGALAMLALAQAGVLGKVIELYRSAVVWALPNRDNPFYYYRNLALNLGLLLDLLPLAAVAAFVFFPRPAGFCASILVFGLVLHSFAGMKDERYVIYLLPYLACLWGMAAWAAVDGMRRRLVALAEGQFGPLARRRAWMTGAGLVLGAAVLLLTVKSVPVLEQTARVVLLPGYRPPNFPHERSWQANAPVLRDLARRAEVFVVDDDLQADFYVGRPDVVLNESRLRENTPPAQFVRDYRTGTPTIGSEEAIRTLLSCFGSGLIVSSDWYLTWLTPGTQALVAGLERVPIGPSPLVAYAWNERRGEPAGDCGATRALLSETSADRARRLGMAAR